MGGPLRKVRAGEPLNIPHAAYNAFVDAALAQQGRQHDVAETPTADLRQTGIVRIRNDSGAARSRGDVLALDGPVITPTANLREFRQRVLFKGKTPATADLGKFAVLLEPLADGRIGRAVMSGVMPVSLSVGHSSHPYADIADGSHALTTGLCGAAEVLWKASTGTGTMYAIIRMEMFQSCRPRVTVTESGGITAGGSGQVTVSATSETLTAYLDWAEGGQAISNGKEAFVYYDRLDAKWRIDGAECE